MAFWNDHPGIDGFVRASDKTLNVLVILLLAAFALGSGAYYWGQMNPRVASGTAQPVAPAPTATQDR